MNHILIIDDEESVRMMLKAFFEDAGYRVKTAKNGNEGIRQYSETPTDVVITDIIMPQKDGLETIMALKRLNPELMIIAMSGGEIAGYKVGYNPLLTSRLLGVERAYAKPVDLEELLMLIQEKIN